MAKKSITLKLITRNSKFSTQFCEVNICNGFSPIDSREVSLKGNGYDFSVDENAVSKSEIITFISN